MAAIGLAACGGSTPSTPLIGIPDAPTGVAAIAGKLQAKVSWTAPANDGGSAITKYEVVVSPGGSRMTVDGSTTSATVEQLEAGTRYTFTVIATNRVGDSAPSSPSKAVTVLDAAPANLAYSQNPAVYTKGAAITDDTPSSSGGVVVSYSVSPALPAGLSLDTSTGVISGTPTALSGAADYTVTATNSGGSTQATLSIAIDDVAPSGLTYSTNPAVYTKGTAIDDDTPSIGGGVVVSYSVSPALPAGLSLDTSTGVISGTPTVASSAADYTITAINSGGSTSAILNVTVVKPPPVVTAASAVDDPIYGPAATAKYPASATDGTHQLYVWSDNRTSGIGRLFATRLGPDGTVLDPAGVELDEVVGGSFSAKVVWNGVFYFVCDLRYATIDSVQHGSLGCFTLSADLTTKGERTEVASARSDTGNSIVGMGVAWDPDDGQFLVAWINKDYASRSAPFTGVRFDANGAAIDASPVTLRPTGPGSFDYDRSFTDITYGGGYYLIASEEGGSACSGYAPEFTRVKASDLSGGGDYGLLSPTCESVRLTSLAYDAAANQFLAVGALSAGTSNSVFLNSISNNPGDTTGTLSARTTLATGASGVFPQQTSIAFNGVQKLVAVTWSASPVTVYAVDGSNQVTASANLTAPTIPSGQSYQSGEVVAQRSSTGWIVTVGDNRIDSGLYAVRLTDTLTTTDGAGIVAATGANGEDLPCVASGGPDNGWLVAWFDSHAGNAFYARRLAPDGTPLDAAPVRLGTTIAFPRACAAAYSAGTYLVVWVNASGTAVAARVDATTGALEDAAPFDLGGAQSNQRPAVAGGTNGFLAIWNSIYGGSCGASSCTSSLMGAHVGVDGTVAEPGGFLISDVTGLGLDRVSGQGADVWFDGTAYQTAYGLTVDYSNGLIFNRAVPESGAPSDAAVQVGSLSSTAFLGPTIAAGAGGGSVIAWTELAGGGATVSARAVLDGVAQGTGPTPLVTGSGAATPGPVQLVSDGTTTWLALESGGFAFGFGGNLISSARVSVSVRPIDAALGVGDVLPFEDTGLVLPGFSFAGDPSGTLLGACSVWSSDPAVQAARIAVRRVQ